jgi:hypothetical protein
MYYIKTNNPTELMVSAVHSEDLEYVAHISTLLAGLPGWEEEALYLRNRIRREEAADWTYDEERDNNI